MQYICLSTEGLALPMIRWVSSESRWESLDGYIFWVLLSPVVVGNITVDTKVIRFLLSPKPLLPCVGNGIHVGKENIQLWNSKNGGPVFYWDRAADFIEYICNIVFNSYFPQLPFFLN